MNTWIASKDFYGFGMPPLNQKTRKGGKMNKKIMKLIYKEQAEHPTFPRSIIQVPAWRKGKTVYEEILNHKREAEYNDKKYVVAHLPSDMIDYLDCYLDKSEMKIMAQAMDDFFIESLGLRLKPIDTMVFHRSHQSVYYIDIKYNIIHRYIFF